ncbi:MAG: DNA adenine methylase [Treponemataceae bacterium]
MITENKEFYTTQLITYLGNKRLLIEKIEPEVERIKKLLQAKNLICADMFSGSGVVARMLKKHSKILIVNDLENYSKMINSCYLINKKDYPADICNEYRQKIIQLCKDNKKEGIICTHYAPKDDHHIKKKERVFYTRENALLIDTYRHLIDEIIQESDLRKFFLAPLITEASIHVNTSGVFKGFYKDKNTGIGCFGGAAKNALSRIVGSVTLSEPVFSNFESELEIYEDDAESLCSKLKNIDIAYLDPPYNQHPYGSNYFMLNLILKNKLDVAISDVSGITQDWNRSNFNKKQKALNSLESIVSSLDAKFLILSYNSEGFISFEQMTTMLKKYGKLTIIDIKYNTFRGSRNLTNRNIHVREYLFILQKH